MHNDTQTCTCEQFLNLHVDLVLDFVVVCLFRFSTLCVFSVSLDYFIHRVACFCCVGFKFL